MRFSSSLLSAIGVLCSLSSSLALDNGLALTPPMGWRSWNLYGANVDQKLLTKIMDGMVSRSRLVDGVPTSLCDLGYCDVGLDDNWQQCGSYGKDAFSYHNEAGFPQVNKDRFPDFIAMTSYAHSLNLTAGWYLNNCICSDHCGSGDDKVEPDSKCYTGDVAALFEFGFDGVKLDGCGKQRSLDVWSSLMNATGKPFMIENCHWGQTVPTADWCPWHFFRSSGDIIATYASVVDNLQTTIQWAQQGLSRPGCWAYPDMLEVGCAHGPHGDDDPGLSFNEARSHFGAWCIVSSPLTLSHDVNNSTLVDSIWPIISNREAIAINQAWFGHSGSPFQSSVEKVIIEHPYRGQQILNTVSAPANQFFYKPLSNDGKKFAVLLMNNALSSSSLSFSFSSLPGAAASCSTSSVSVRDVWSHTDIGSVHSTFQANVDSHDSAFITVTCA